MKFGQQVSGAYVAKAPTLRMTLALKEIMKSWPVIAIRTAYALVILLLIAIAIPSRISPPARRVIPLYDCINNLRMIDSAKEQWSYATNQTNGTPPDIQAINQYLKGNTTPECPAGGVYSYNPVGTDPTCSITSPEAHVLPKLK